MSTQSKSLVAITARSLAVLVVARAGVVAADEPRADATSPAWYTGASTDSTHVEVFRGAGWEAGDASPGLSVRGGLRVSKHFAVEFAGLRAGGLEWTEYYASIPGLPGAYDAHTTFDVTALTASVVGIVPFGKIWEFFFKGGIAQYRVSGEQRLDDSFDTGLDETRAVSDSGSGTLLGLGFALAPASRWRVRIEAQFFDINEDFLGVPDGHDPTIDSFEIGVDYALGGR